MRNRNHCNLIVTALVGLSGYTNKVVFHGLFRLSLLYVTTVTTFYNIDWLYTVYYMGTTTPAYISPYSLYREWLAVAVVANTKNHQIHREKGLKSVTTWVVTSRLQGGCNYA